jgi:hypothetical protein
MYPEQTADGTVVIRDGGECLSHELGQLNPSAPEPWAGGVSEVGGRLSGIAGRVPPTSG